MPYKDITVDERMEIVRDYALRLLKKINEMIGEDGGWYPAMMISALIAVIEYIIHENMDKMTDEDIELIRASIMHLNLSIIGRMMGE